MPDQDQAIRPAMAPARATAPAERASQCAPGFAAPAPAAGTEPDQTTPLDLRCRDWTSRQNLSRSRRDTEKFKNKNRERSFFRACGDPLRPRAAALHAYLILGLRCSLFPIHCSLL